MKYCPYCLKQNEEGFRVCVHCSKRIIFKGTDKELSYYKIMVKLHPNAPSPHNDCAYIYTMQGKFDLALFYLDRVLELVPDRELAINRRQAILEKQKSKIL